MVDPRPSEIGAALSAAALSSGANTGDDNHDGDGSGSDIGDDEIGQAHTEVVESFRDSVKFAIGSVDAENGGGGTHLSLSDNPLFPNTETRFSSSSSSSTLPSSITLPSPKAGAFTTTATSVSDAISAQQQLHPAALARQASAAGAAAFAAKRSGMLHVVLFSQYQPH